MTVLVKRLLSGGLFVVGEPERFRDAIDVELVVLLIDEVSVVVFLDPEPESVQVVLTVFVDCTTVLPRRGGNFLPYDDTVLPAADGQDRVSHPGRVRPRAERTDAGRQSHVPGKS